MSDPRSTAAGPSEPSDPHPESAALARLSGLELARAIAAGTHRASEVVAVLAARAEVLEADTDGRPGLRALLEVSPGAADEAAAVDAEERSGVQRSQLAGAGVLVKDNIDTAGLATTAGSLALAQADPPTEDATVVARLRAAGLVVLAKANLSEWANYRGRRSLSGWSAVGGQCRNPWALDRSPGGSSSGSAAGVAAGYAPLALGTETDGSILCPAALNGLVGVKPSVGLVSRTGVVPISASQDTVGPLCRTVADAAALLDVIAGEDPSDPATLGLRRPEPGAYLAAAEEGAAHARELGGVRLGVLRSTAAATGRGTAACFDQVLGELARAGATLLDPVDLSVSRLLIESGGEEIVLAHEFKVGVEAYLARRRHAPSTLADLRRFNEEHAAEELALFGQELFDRADATGGLDDPVYLEARETTQRRARGGLDALFHGRSLSALVVPTMDPAWLIDPVNGNRPGPAGYSVAAVAGYPAVTVPMGVVDHLPVGFCLLGRRGAEEELLRLAAAVEVLVGFDVGPAWRRHTTG